MSKFLSEKLKSLKSYVPGEQPKDMQYIKLNTNESPYAPTPKAVERITKEELEKLKLYSDPEAVELVLAIADFYDVKAENVITSNGSDEILAFAFKAFCDEKREICFPDVSYGFYPVYADLYGLKKNEIPLDDKLQICAKDYLNVQKNVIIANPNAQTGNYLEPSDIEKIVVSNPNYVVMVDEAYVDFGGESVVPLTKKYDNLLVIQTFSKSRSMAGARIGFAVGDKALIDDLKKVKYSFNPYNLNRLSIMLGAEAMKDREYFDKFRMRVAKTREWTREQLVSRGFAVTNSKANFLLASSDAVDGKKLYLALKERGVLVRYLGDERIANWVRITIGSDSEMQTLIERIDEILKEKL